MKASWIAGILVAAAMAACSGSGDSSAGSSPPPSRSGAVWEVDNSGGRATAPGAMVAFANGLQTVVIDGDDIYAGMTKLSTAAAPQGGRVVQLGNGESAVLKPAGDGLDVQFSSGETVHMHKQVRQPRAGS